MESKTVIYGSNQFEAAKRLKKMEELDNKKTKQPIKILQCPCCGAEAHHYDRNERNTIECTKCGMRTPIKNRFEDCLAIWNKRI